MPSDPIAHYLRFDTDFIANLSVKWVLVAVGLLLLLRLTMGRTAVHERTPLDGLAELIESALIAFVLVFLIIRPFVVQAFFIPSESMKPTLLRGDRILVNKFIYRFRPPGHGDVVVFRAPHEVSYDEKDFIKRVVAVPGDRIAVFPDRVLVDDRVVWQAEGMTHTRYRFSFDPGQSRVLDGGGVRNPRIEALNRHLIVSSSFENDLLDIYLGDPESLRVAGDQVIVGRIASIPVRPYEPVEIRTSVEGADPAIELAAAYVQGRPRVIVARGTRLIADHGHVILNGKALREATIAEPPAYEMSERVVPPGKYFVMGDNRNDSNDSHMWADPFLDANRIIGRAEFIFWPPGRIRPIR